MAEEAVFSFVLETLGALVRSEAEFLLGVDDQIGILQQRLKQMRWFLRDANAHQDRGKRVLEWVLHVRDLAYEAEDLIETYAFKIASRRRRGVVGKIKRFGSFLYEGYLRHQLGSDVDSLLEKISDMTKNYHEYGIKSIMENIDGSSSNNGGGSGSSGGNMLRRTYSIVAGGDDIFIGVESDTEKLASILVGEDYSVVGMCGMGGIGKTTLARKVYHHPLVKDHFEGFVWVCISQQWNKNDILSGILIKLMPEKRDSIERWRDEELLRELSQALQNRRCLVVLDDIWQADAWECMKHGFPIGVKGSKVLITTRNMAVFTQIDANGFLHEPRLLSTDESWELLCRKGILRKYTDQDSQEHERFEELGKDMVTHCGGLPLAVMVLGGILSAKSSYSEWIKVHRNIKSFLGNGKNNGIDHGKISHVLALSYDELPFELKPCFLYLSKYAEDEDIDLEALYQIWMAEGMVSAGDRLQGETMMEVAERYLEELAERCMVFVEKEKLPRFLQLKSCHLHDIMRELCLLKAREENFLELAGDGHYIYDEDPSALRGTTFRLTINLLDSKHAESFIPPTNAFSRRLRSFSLVVTNLRELHSWEPVQKLKAQFGKFMLLRVLCLERCDFRVASCLKSICTLVHLRYLSFRNSYLAFPPSISNLTHLHSLDLRVGTQDVSISTEIESLEQLKHLYLPHDFVRNDVKFRKLERLGSFEIRELDFQARKLGFQRLQKLEILENFQSRRCDARQLVGLRNLRSLSAEVYNTDELKLFVDQVCNLTNLRFLVLRIWQGEFLTEEELAMLKDLFSLQCLNAMTIEGCLMSTFPSYEPGFCKNLHTLSLFGNDGQILPMVEDPIATLENFPNLINLTLGECFNEREMIMHGHGFPKLQSLRLLRLIDLENWIIEDGALPHLSHLSIVSCFNLKMVPQGIRFLTSLTELSLFHMPDEFNSRVQVKDNQQGADFEIVRHIPSIIIK